MTVGLMKATLACPVCGASRALVHFNISKDGQYMGPEVRYDLNYKEGYSAGPRKVWWETHVPSIALLQNLQAQMVQALEDLDALIELKQQGNEDA